MLKYEDFILTTRYYYSTNPSYLLFSTAYLFLDDNFYIFFCGYYVGIVITVCKKSLTQELAGLIADFYSF